MSATDPVNFLFLNGNSRWDGFHLSGLTLGPNGALRLESLPRFEGDLPPQISTLAAPTAPAGVAIAADGTVYFTDPDTNRLLWRNGCTPAANPVPAPCVGGTGGLPTQFRSPRGLLFHPVRGCLFVCDSGNHRLQAFDPATFQLVDVWGGPGTAPGLFQTPWTLAGDSAGNVYVVDYGNRRVQKFSLAGTVMPEFWTAVQKSISDQHLALTTPANVAVGTTADGQIRIYILDAGSKTVFVFDANGTHLHHFGGGALENPMGLAAIAGAIFVGDNLQNRPGRVLEFREDGALVGTAVGYRGPVAALAVDARQGLWINCGAGVTPLCLTLNAGFSQGGFLWGGPFHNPSLRPREWHSFLASVDLPAGAHIQFYIFASVNGQPPPGLGDAPPWKQKPSQTDIAPWLAGGQPAPNWMAVSPDVTEGMIPAGPPDPPAPGQSAHVNDVWIGAALSGDGTSSPALSQIRIDFDRDTLLSHLPDIYSENTASRLWLGRWLTLFGTVFGGVEQEISGLRRLFDSFATRPEWLDWLGGWLAVDLNETWDDVTKRRTIAQAFDTYRRRGTAEGLHDALLQLAGVDTRVEEPIQQAAWWLLPQNADTPPLGGAGSILGFTTMLAPAEPQGAVAGTTAVLDQSRLLAADDLGAALFEDVAHQFRVTVYRGQVNTEQKLNAVRTLVDREKPAHTLCHVCVIDPKMRIGFQARLGIDTVIAGPTPPTRLGELTASGPEMILAGAAPGRIGGGSRIGQTTLLSDAAVEGPTLSP